MQVLHIWGISNELFPEDWCEEHGCWERRQADARDIRSFSELSPIYILKIEIELGFVVVRLYILPSPYHKMANELEHSSVIVQFFNRNRSNHSLSFFIPLQLFGKYFTQL